MTKPKFRPKQVPLITRGRIQHAVFGALIVLLSGLVPYWLHTAPKVVDGAQWGMVFVFFFALIWEAGTPYIAKHFFPQWDHPYGDFPDWMAYFLGGALPLMVIGPFGC